MNYLPLNKQVPVLFIIIFACILWLGQYNLRHLWEPDEPRYTYVAKEMAQNGSLLVPVRSGKFYAHKPPLMFWLIQVSTLVTGGEFNGISGRLPTLLGVILSLWALSRMSAMWYDKMTAWATCLIVSTSFLFWHKAGTGQIDMLLLGLEMCALYLLFKNDETPAFYKSVIAFSLMGMAILAKGPIGLIVPIGIYITGNIFAGDKKNILKIHWLWGIPLALLWPVMWLVLARINGAPSEYFKELLFDQNVGRFNGEFGGHYKPFYYYIKYLLSDFLPWTFFIPITVYLLSKHKVLKKQSLRLLGWIVFVVVFFSLAGGKRNLYILSVYPAESLLIASVFPYLNNLPKKWGDYTVYTLLVFLSFLCVASLAVLFAPLFIEVPISTYVVIPNSIVFFIGTYMLFILYGKQGLTRKWFSYFIAFLIITELCVGMIIFPALNSVKTPVALAEAVRNKVPENETLISFGMNGEIFALFSNRQGQRIDDPELLLNEMKRREHGIVVFPGKKWKKLSDHFQTLGNIQSFKMGNKDLVWLEYGYQ